MEQIIKLTHNAWTVNLSNQIGQTGGFGRVFTGEDPNGRQVAIKRLDVTGEVAGNREMKMADFLHQANSPNVISVLDFGLDLESGRYFIVMEKAEYSLRDFLENAGAQSEHDAIQIMVQIAKGLEQLADVIHRDIKPQNILYKDGNWKISDFGISKFVEGATSINTLKECLSPRYASPEQWNQDTVSKASDVYSAGIIFFELLNGHLPVKSGENSDWKQFHITGRLPEIQTDNALLKQIITSCTRKSPEARLSHQTLSKRLSSVDLSVIKESSISKVSARLAQEQAEKDAIRKTAEYKEKARFTLAKDAFEILREITNELFKSIRTQTVVARELRNGITLGKGSLIIQECFPVFKDGVFHRSKLDIVCGAIVVLKQKNDRYPGRSSNLWFAKRDNEYGWWEIGYMNTPFGGTRRADAPFGFSDSRDIDNIDLAESHIMASYQRGTRWMPIDGEHTESFIRRWSDRLATAAESRLQHPGRLPEL